MYPAVGRSVVLIQPVLQQSYASWESSDNQIVDVNWQLDRKGSPGHSCQTVWEVARHCLGWEVSNDGRIVQDQILAQQKLSEIAVVGVEAAAVEMVVRSLWC